MAKRFDAIRVDKLELTDEGYIKTTGTVTRTGIFTYRNPDGTMRRELRHPDDVFKKESLDSLKLIPLTNDHPSEEVTPENVKHLSIGTTGENAVVDSPYIHIPISVTDRGGIQALQAGRVQLSLGYSLDLDETPGEFDGLAYDVRQKNIRYNHLALVDVARAGDAAKLHLDSDDAILIGDSNTSNKEIRMPLIRLDDGCDYETPQQVIAAMARKDAELETLRKGKIEEASKLSSITAERDSALEKVAVLEKQDIEKMVTERVDARNKLLVAATKATGNKDTDGKEIAFDTMSDVDIKKTVVSHVFPKSNFDGKDGTYINTRFDIAMEEVESRADTDTSSMATQRQQSASVQNADGDKHSADSARQRMIDRMTGKIVDKK